ncbi:MAG TPA: hypothetical protein VM509_13495 [Planctomycetota bacterium]|nr:hypothetical protein [Planctomycetota bacterium]
MIRVPDALAIPAAIALAAGLAVLAPRVLTDRRARFAAIAAAPAAAILAFYVLSPASLMALAISCVSLALRVRGGRATTIGAGTLALIAVAIEPAIGAGAVAFAAWEGRRALEAALEVGIAAVLLVLLSRSDAPRAIAILAVSALLVGLLSARLRPVGRVPPRRESIGLARAGAALGVFALVVANETLGLVGSDDVSLALVMAIPAALAGVAASAIVIGALALLAVSDRARTLLLASMACAGLAALVSMQAAFALALPGAVLAFAAGAARLARLVPPSFRFRPTAHL